MSLKIVFLCAQLLLIKTVFTQCLGPRPFTADIPGRMGIPGKFESSLLLEKYPMPTPGLSIMTDDLIIEGMVSVAGNLPFLGTVAIEGVVPTEGHGSVLYGCGNGDVKILADNSGPYGPMAGPVGPMGPKGPMNGPYGPGFPGPKGPAFPLGPGLEPGMRMSMGLGAKPNSLGFANL